MLLPQIQVIRLWTATLGSAASFAASKSLFGWQGNMPNICPLKVSSCEAQLAGFLCRAADVCAFVRPACLIDLQLMMFIG